MNFKTAAALFILSFPICNSAYAQAKDSLVDFKPHGSFWGLAFGDFAFKPDADTVGDGLGRGANQYSRMPKNSRLFQFRRVYLGYNYDITPKFSAEVLLAAEDNIYPGSVGNQTNNGDVLADNRFSPFLKLINIRWKNIYKGADLVFGQVATPAFPLLVEGTWGYRSIEKTSSDLRRTPSFDQGITLQGKLGKEGKYGYNLMVGNGTGAVPEGDAFQWFYGDVWAKLFDKKLIIDLYQDYQKMDWTPIVDGETGSFHHDRNMTKLFVAYTVPKLTVGFEAFTNTLMGDIEASSLNKSYYRTTVATSLSVFARGRIYKDMLGFFVRYDNFDPSHKIKDVTNDSRIISYVALSTRYDPTTKEQFATCGLDFTPTPNVHIMPNFWISTYDCALSSKDYGLNIKASGVKGTDAVFRLTVNYMFGKK